MRPIPRVLEPGNNNTTALASLFFIGHQPASIAKRSTE
jgi:hypothetical protein